jgi:hypothetical protein
MKKILLFTLMLTMGMALLYLAALDALPTPGQARPGDWGRALAALLVL